MKTRVLMLFTGFVIAWSLILARAGQLQLLPNARLGELQGRQYKTIIDLPARRGVITDRKGKELAVSVPSYSAFADPRLVKEPRRFAKQVARALGHSESALRTRIKDKEKRFVWIDRDVASDVVEDLKKLNLRGLGIVEESKRVYPNGELLAQTLGFVGQDGGGLEGLELRYDDKLKGESRKIKLERDARGRPLLIDGRIFADTPAGHDLELTIDSELQYLLESELKRVVRQYNADSAVGIILEPHTFEILAMANAPLYDPNRPRASERDTWRNRVVTDAFEPGSTVKTFVVAGAIGDGLVKPSTKINCENGQYVLGKRIIREADSKHKFGDLTVSEVLAKSSNVGSTKIALKIGDKKVRKILETFGFGIRSGIDVPGEAAGVLHKTPWRDHLLANISFGHGVTATPLQIAAAYGAIANGGMLKKPFIVKRAIHSETGETIEYLSENVRRVLNTTDARTMRLILNSATSDSGTGQLAQVPGYPVAGKTGTAQKATPGKGYDSGQYVSSFAGFLPAQDPKFVIYVAIDNPKKSYYGAEVAAPLFSRVASVAVRHVGLAPVLITEKNIIRNQDTSGPREKSMDTIRQFAKMLLAEEQNVTPDFTGLTLREVLNRVRGSEIQVELRGEGVVFLTVPSAGHPLPDDKTLKVYFKEI